jgi:hypothetical protein
MLKYGMGHEVSLHFDTPWFNRFLEEKIDGVIKIKDKERRNDAFRKSLCLMITALIRKHVPTDTLDHLMIEPFVRNGSPVDEEDDSVDPELTRIKDILAEEFGHEVINKIRIKMLDAKGCKLHRDISSSE